MPALQGVKSGLGGVPGALADRASDHYAAALTEKINATLGGGGGRSGGKGGGGVVGASVFGGPNEPGTGHTGYHGDDLRKHPDSFAELSKNPAALDFSALGGLPFLVIVAWAHELSKSL